MSSADTANSNQKNKQKHSKNECQFPGDTKDIRRLFLVFAAIAAVVGVMILITWVTFIIFERQNNFAGALAFAFVVGWPATMLVLPTVLWFSNLCRPFKLGKPKSACHGFSDKIRCPCYGRCYWWPSYNYLILVFCVFCFVVMTTFATRLVPFMYLYSNMAEIKLEQTPSRIQAKGFIWLDAKLDTQNVTRGSSVAVGQRCHCACSGDDKCCRECEPIDVNIKYCLAPVVPSRNTTNLEFVPAAAICFWFPCRQLASWEGSRNTKVSDHDWDHTCEGDPSEADCAYECGPDANMPSPGGPGLDGLTILNGVKIYGRNWASPKAQAIPFRHEDATVVFKYEVKFDDVFNHFNGVMIPALTQRAGKPILRTPELNEPMLVRWGDQPFQYYTDGLIISVAVGSGALIIVSPFIPFAVKYLWKSSRKSRSVASVIGMGILLVAYNALPLAPLIITLGIRGSDSE